MVRTFLKVYMELGSYFLFLQEQIKDIVIIISLVLGPVNSLLWYVPSSRYIWSLAPIFCSSLQEQT
jgi:hypothetical protein